MEPVTLWFVEKNGGLEFHHLADYHFTPRPIPRSKDQEGWNNLRWHYQHAYRASDGRITGHLNPEPVLSSTHVNEAAT